MTKTLTISDAVYKKLVSVKGEDEGFSELLERLLKGQSPSEILKGLRGRIEFDRDEKRKLLAEIYSRRQENRV
jgi:predicted CopG family antitoxin